MQHWSPPVTASVSFSPSLFVYMVSHSRKTQRHWSVQSGSARRPLGLPRARQLLPQFTALIEVDSFWTFLHSLFYNSNIVYFPLFFFNSQQLSCICNKSVFCCAAFTSVCLKMWIEVVSICNSHYDIPTFAVPKSHQGVQKQRLTLEFLRSHTFWDVTHFFSIS